MRPWIALGLLLFLAQASVAGAQSKPAQPKTGDPRIVIDRPGGIDYGRPGPGWRWIDPPGGKDVGRPGPNIGRYHPIPPRPQNTPRPGPRR